MPTTQSKTVTKRRSVIWAWATFVLLVPIPFTATAQTETLLSECATESDVERLKSLLEKSLSISDVAATVRVGEQSQKLRFTYKYYHLTPANLSRIEHNILSSDPAMTIIYFIDGNKRTVYAEGKGKLVSADQRATALWLSVAESLAIPGNLDLSRFQRVYYAGEERQKGRTLEVYLLTRNQSVFHKLWVGRDDGFVYKHENQALGVAYDFRDLSFNSGFGEEFFRPNIKDRKIPVVTRDELIPYLMLGGSPHDEDR